MKLVILESPFAGEIARNTRYARACLRDSLLRGEAPLASHLLYTQDGVLDDSTPSERALGISAGHAWIPHADLMAVYTDFGISNGMRIGVEEAVFWKKPIDFRTLPGFPKSREPVIYLPTREFVLAKRARAGAPESPRLSS